MSDTKIFFEAFGVSVGWIEIAIFIIIFSLLIFRIASNRQMNSNLLNISKDIQNLKVRLDLDPDALIGLAEQARIDKKARIDAEVTKVKQRAADLTAQSEKLSDAPPGRNSSGPKKSRSKYDKQTPAFAGVSHAQILKSLIFGQTLLIYAIIYI